MRRFSASIAATLFASVMAATAFTGQASAQPNNAVERFTIVKTNDVNGRVIATGVFTAVGTDVATNASSDTFTFPNGTVVLSHTETEDHASFDPVSCVGRVSGHGTYTITGGTGAYAGISGHGTDSFRLTMVAAHTLQGCSEEPVAQVDIVRLVGPVSFA